ncbi:uncharacterized protein TRUGW13939_11244 [Talaromyces rugulosus]|uniref:Uncharacterized protein n=1 Tax=Talaromyces rugulosus TaxID=121627 RepID=A0A7H8REE2_TALRU|nr:uncharacterized protein TRUGW13939_11244 [Talaromyces rugulosus]QKX64071.1 hypothetical protein TRUGW13939_11244 [Talaromyces rugulosus]
MTEDRMTTPTLINLPPPPSDPVTPSDMGPGTPNSGTTSLSALSTTAIKDGHQGHTHPYARHAHQSSSTSSVSSSTLDAERADRISRLAGLERIATARGGGGAGGAAQNFPSSSSSGAPNLTPSQGYFDSYPHMVKERSTVGSASATGSVGGRTTWASGSDAYDPDKMSLEDHDDGTSSMGGMSDEGNASLVGFGEGASSTISGPVSSATLGRLQQQSTTTGLGRTPSFGSPSANRNSGNHSNINASGQYPAYMQQQQQQQHVAGSSVSAPSQSSPSPAGSNTPEPSDDARMLDGVTYDSNVVDTTVRTPRLVGQRGPDSSS